MTVRRWVAVLGSGLLAGLVAALVMTLVMLLMRYLLGISSPAELGPDRMAPTIEVNRFLRLLSRWGGYNRLKQLGVGSVLLGQLAFGGLFGMLYAIIVERARRREPERTWRLGTSRGAALFVAAGGLAAWLGTVIFVSPVLDVSFRGLPPGRATVVTVLGLLFAYATFGMALILAYRAITTRQGLRGEAPLGPPIGRRALLVGGVGGVLLLASGGMLRRLYGLATFSYDGTRLRGPELAPVTPNEQFYVVTKNVIDPSVWKRAWRLDVNGLVDNARTYDFDDLASMPAVTQETTLMCISNGVGDGLISNAMWKGVPLRNLIEAAGPKPGIVEVLMHAADGYTDSIPIAKAMEPATLVVYEMNGTQLPERHGYPVRLIVPGMYGEKNLKWVTRIELVDHDAKGFYEQQGWGPDFVIPTRSQFLTPARGQVVGLGTVPVKGLAFGGDRGVARVEVSADDGRTWEDAKLDYPGSQRSWALWSYEWRPARAGEYKLTARATDKTGEVQTVAGRGIVPQGATGYHRVTVQVEA